METVSGQSVVVATKDQVSCDLAEEAVVLSLNNSTYYSLNSLGARIWSLIQKPRSVSEIRSIILEEYDVDPDRCEKELLDLLRKLAVQGLIEIRE